MLETNDKQHFILLHENQQLQNTLATVQAELALAVQQQHNAAAINKSTESLLQEAQVCCPKPAYACLSAFSSNVLEQLCQHYVHSQHLKEGRVPAYTSDSPIVVAHLLCGVCYGLHLVPMQSALTTCCND